MKKIVNLTPHALNLYKGDKLVETIPPAGKVARVKLERVVIGDVNGFPITKTNAVSVENVPDPEPDTIYVVSGFVLSVLTDRPDVVAPDTDTESVVRDEANHIIGVRGFRK